MAFYKQSELAKLLGKSQAHVTMAVKRGKLLLSGDFVDDTVLENKIWIDRQKANSTAKVEVPKVEPVPEVVPVKTPVVQAKKLKEPILSKPKQRILKDFVPTDVERTSESIADLDKAKKEAEIRYKESQTRLSELKEQKLRGENIPTDLVMNVIGMLGHSLQSSYKNGAAQLMHEISTRTKMNVELEAEFNGRLIDLINISHSDAITEAKKSIKNIINESSSVETIETESDE
jgi:hypothetical protein